MCSVHLLRIRLDHAFGVVEDALKTEVEIRLVRSASVVSIPNGLSDDWCGFRVNRCVWATARHSARSRLISKALQHSR